MRLPRRFAPRNDALGLFTVKIPLDPPETPPFEKGGPGGIFMRGGDIPVMSVYEAIKTNCQQSSTFPPFFLAGNSSFCAPL
jgi:hypothetical protein